MFIPTQEKPCVYPNSGETLCLYKLRRNPVLITEDKPYVYTNSGETLCLYQLRSNTVFTCIPTQEKHQLSRNTVFIQTEEKPCNYTNTGEY